MKFFKKKKVKIGLALGSGAARGLAHIGVLKALKEEGISIDMLSGSSMGALVGACYARKAEIAEFEEIALKIDWKQLARLADPNLALLF
ncbi:patatin-like phospholipase family protein, partial [bacterium]|nr:patatin-like phospholipase family protein [bacterium]